MYEYDSWINHTAENHQITGIATRGGGGGNLVPYGSELSFSQVKIPDFLKLLYPLYIELFPTFSQDIPSHFSLHMEKEYPEKRM